MNTSGRIKEKNISKPPYQLQKSPISGTGIFATRDIPRGEIIARLNGTVHHKVHRDVHDVLGNHRWIKISKNVAIDPIYPFSHINHSCDPSVGIIGRRDFAAIRSIKKGEELTFDYAIAEDDARWFMRCLCGSPKCRSYVRSIHFLPKTTFKKYLPFVPTYFQKVYKQYYGIK